MQTGADSKTKTKTETKTPRARQSVAGTAAGDATRQQINCNFTNAMHRVINNNFQQCWIKFASCPFSLIYDKQNVNSIPVFASTQNL